MNMKIGLLPLYIALYDETSPGARPRMEKFYDDIAKAFEKRGLEVETSAFCRLKPEFDRTVAAFEKAGCDAIVTLHIAYSPSLESIEALCKTDLPIIVLDTTDTLEFLPTGEDHIMYCHGIHGVMDMCSMLTRYDKPYAIAAGHYTESDCIDRAAGLVRAAVAATNLKKAKVTLIGGAFQGMGDFTVSPAEFKEVFGATISDADAVALGKIYDGITDEEVAVEIEAMKARFPFADDIVEDEFHNAIRSGLAVRKYVNDNGFTAFSANFLKVGEGSGVSSMPFIEACLAMERGIGYAGEGDGLTAAFTGALLSAYPETSFVEIFCPDWKNNMVLLSHMGEVNYRIGDVVPTIQSKGGNLTGGTMPYVGYTRMKGGKGAYINVSRAADGYKLVIAPSEMLSVGEDNFGHTVRGWLRPEVDSTAEFLEKLSINGATHHSVFVYGATKEEMEFFGRLLGMEVVTIG